MNSPLVAIKEAIRQWLVADPILVTMLHEAKVHIDIPKHMAFPFVAFVSARADENGTSLDEGHAMDLVLGVWSRHRGSSEGLSIARNIEQRLASLPVALAGHQLVNLIVRSVEALRQRDGETWITQIRIRAVTEVI